MKFQIEPRDVPAKMAARRLGMTLDAFIDALPNLIARGFPKADPDSHNYDLDAINRWCDGRHSHLFGDGKFVRAMDAGAVAKDRLKALRESNLK